MSVRGRIGVQCWFSSYSALSIIVTSYSYVYTAYILIEIGLHDAPVCQRNCSWYSSTCLFSSTTYIYFSTYILEYIRQSRLSKIDFVISSCLWISVSLRHLSLSQKRISTSKTSISFSMSVFDGCQFSYALMQSMRLNHDTAGSHCIP